MKTPLWTKVLRIAIGLLPVLMAALSVHGQPGSTGRATGLLPPTPADREWMDRSMMKVKRVHLNQLAVQRINAHRRSQGLPPINLPTVPLGDEVIPEGAIGLASLNNPPAGGTLPPAVDNSKLDCFPPIRDQGQLGSCASFSTTYYVGTHMLGLARGWKNRNPDNATKLSPKWTYSMVNGGQDKGSWFTTTIEVLTKHGGATWSDFPYVGEKDDVNFLEWSMKPEVWRNAVNYRMDKSGKISDLHTAAGLNELKALLANGYAVLFATDVYGWQFYAIKNDPSTAEDDAFVGKRICAFVKAKESGHAMTIVGYNDHLWVDLNKNGTVDTGEKGALRICNSWGEDWLPGGSGAPADGGFTWLSYDALKATSAVSGADNTSRVPGAYGASSSWRTPFWYNEVYFFSARPAYAPKLLGQFTLTHRSREELKVELGRSSTSATTPAQTWKPGAVSEQGGSFPFNGGQNAVEGTFVFDFTDLAATGPNRYYLLVTDIQSSTPATLHDFRLTDAAGNTLGVAQVGLPGTADNSTTVSYIDYTLNTLAITSRSSTNGTVGVALSFAVTATGNPTSFGATGLPPGLQINPTTGLISGTPTEPGTFSASLRVSSPQGTGSGTLTFTIARAIINPPAITSSTTASGTVGTAFNYAITANGNPASFGANDLPPGLSLNEATGVISGTPTQAGIFTVQLSASNAGGRGSRALTITINPPPLPAPVITSATTATIQSGSPFTYRIIASNNPTSFGADGLPAGLTLDPNSGLIAGTPPLGRQYVITLSAKNVSGTGYAKLVLTVLGESSFGPSNDSFSNRSPLPGSAVSIKAGNNNATAETGEPGHAGASASKSVWWTWTAPAAGTVTITTVGSSFNTLLAIYTGTEVGRLTSVASDDQSGGNNASAVTFNTTESISYQIAVDGRDGAVGNLVLNVQFTIAVAAPPNDNFAGRSPLSGSSFSATGRNVGASAEAAEPAHAGSPAAKSVWWTWTAPSAGRVTITTFGSDFDTVLAVYSGSALGTLTPVASDDQSGQNNTSQATFLATANTAYQIAVDGYNGAAGNINLRLELGPDVIAPANDHFEKRSPLSGSNVSVTGSNDNATAQIGEPEHAGLPAAQSIWWTWTAPATGVATAVTTGSNFDTLLAVYTGNSLSALAEVASNDDDGDQITSRIAFPVVSGTAYHIAVDGFDGFDKGSGNISLSLELRSGGPANDHFANRISLSGAKLSTSGANINATAEPAEPDHDDFPAESSVWWSWTAPSSGRITLTTAGSSFDTILAAYTGTTLAQLVPIASNDEDGEEFTSRVSFVATAGTTYQIAIDGFEGVSGTIQLSGSLVDVGDTLYETDFETFSSGMGELVGNDGWKGENADDEVQGIVEDVEEFGKVAYLGLSEPTDSFVSVYRPLSFDPIGAKRPLVTFSVELGIADSTNDEYDSFAFSLYNRAGQFLAAIIFNNDTLEISYASSENSSKDTGQTFENDVPYQLTATIDFAANTWSASLDGLTLFKDQPFHVGGLVRDLGDISVEWHLTDQSNPGDNVLLFDNYSVSASAGAKGPSITAQPESQTASPGDFAVFVVTAAGSAPLNYQWQFNGSALPGQTNAFLLLFDVQPSDGGTYRAVVSNSAGEVTSAPVTLTVSRPNVLPAVVITSPETGLTLNAPATIILTATASDSDGAIAYVEFYQGASKLGEDRTAPYSFTWSNVAAGNYQLQARAVDNLNGATASTPVNITVKQLGGGSVTLQISLSPQPRIEWLSQAGLSYQLQYTTDLSNPNWRPLGQTLSGTGGILSVTDAAATGLQRFYRLAPSSSSLNNATKPRSRPRPE